MLALTGVIVGVFALLLVGGGAVLAYKMLLSHDDRATAAYAPKDSIGYVAINTDPTSRAWLDAWELAKKAGIDDELSGLPKDGLEGAGESGATWDDLIKPAIGKEIGFAVWPKGSTAEDMPGFAAIVMVADEDKARQTIDKVFEGETPTPATYRDVTYQTDDDTAVGIVDDALIVTSSEEDFNHVIDAHLDGALDDVDAFTSAADRAADNPLIFAWMDSAAVADLGEQYGEAGSVDLGMQDALDAYREIGNVTMTAKADGSALRFVTLTEGRPEMFPTKPAGDTFASEVPASTLFYAASADLYGTIWKPIMAQMEQASGITGGEIPTTDDLDSMFGIDVKGGLLARLTGEYAVSMSVAEDSSNAYGYGGEFHFISGVDDSAKVLDTVNTLADTLETGVVAIQRTDDGFSFEEDGVMAEVTVHDGVLRVTGRYGSADGSGSLSDDPSYQAAMKGMSDDASITGYVALNRIIDLIPESGWSDIPADSRAAIEALGPLSWASGPDGDGTRTDVVLVIE
jgi:hypothetical protein